MSNPSGLQENCTLSINDCVVYKKHGICRIEDIRNENFSDMGERKYYVLTSVFGPSSKLYVPADGEMVKSSIRRVLTVTEIEDAITVGGKLEVNLPQDVKERTAFFEEVIDSFDRARIYSVYKTLTKNKENLFNNKKTLKATDEKMLTLVQKILFDEISFVVDIERDKVLEYIESVISKKR